MILAFDTYYFGDQAKTVCLAFETWAATEAAMVYSETLVGIANYVPGQFYKRELPCILSLLQQIDITNVKAIVVDGYVYLNDEHAPGLGRHLYDAVQRKIPIIGVAKSNFATLNKSKLLLLRGSSINPLYITSVGIDLQTAGQYIAAMTGLYRIPTLLKALDRETKTV
ncbi:endonuclease V [Mucilaginibacter sp. CSA2-8R]|uniref:endonuclease V n=1 Tax=Mucilaginibacter sp. CSA2-8R TaxID=3141542 RepID=UPI00315CE7E3